MSASFTKWFPSGFRLINGLTLSNWFNQPLTSTEDEITATAGGTQAAAYQLTAAKSRITVCANAGDSVKLPNSQTGGPNGSSLVGFELVIINDGAANLDVYPSSATVNSIQDNIDAVGINTAVVITTPKRAIFFYTSAGVISSLEGAKAT